MAFPTIAVLNSSGAPTTVNTLPNAGQATSASSLSVVLASDALADPAGAAITGFAMPAGGVGITGWLSAIWAEVSTTLTVSVSNAALAVTASALPLPSGAATAASQTNVQSTPGTAQTKALTIQGNASGIAVPTVESYSNQATNQVSVASSATLICAARSGRKEVTIVNHGTTDVFLGATGVAATTGLLLAGVKGTGQTMSGGAAVYGIAASGSQTVSFQEVY